MQDFNSHKSGILYSCGSFDVSSGYDSLDEPTFEHDNSEEWSIMQFTGLQDKNGVDIYEGDIVYIIKDRFGDGHHEVWSIVYGYFGDAAFYVQNNINSGRLIEVDVHPHFSIDGSVEISLQVIGNIHENKELL